MGAVSLSMHLALTTLCLRPLEHVAQEQVDLIEVNHYYDHRGKLVLDQVIFYEWCSEQGRFQVRDWRLLKTTSQVPRRDWRRRDYVSFWRDGEFFRRVRAPLVRETWTMFDPEVADREFLPRHRRRSFPKVANCSLTALSSSSSSER